MKFHNTVPCKINKIESNLNWIIYNFKYNQNDVWSNVSFKINAKLKYVEISNFLSESLFY